MKTTGPAQRRVAHVIHRLAGVRASSQRDAPSKMNASAELGAIGIDSAPIVLNPRQPPCQPRSPSPPRAVSRPPQISRARTNEGRARGQLRMDSSPDP